VKSRTPLPGGNPYPGHIAVTPSVVEGLRAIDADFNFNPQRRRDIARIVYAPANEALRQAIGLKRRGAIDYLAAGPTNALVPEEEDGLIQAPEIDRLIIGCEWARDLFAGTPHLAPKLRVCPVGVDAAQWSPSGRVRQRRALIYWKSGDETFCAAVEDVVRRAGLEPVRVPSGHGRHDLFAPEHLREALDAATVGVYLSAFETQGIALAEAWAMDVPTLVWDPQEVTHWRGHAFRAGSSAPYLTAATGCTWKTIAELETSLAGTLRDLPGFTPRAWVLAHMTDAVCARRLYELLTRDPG
jgi:hypothetical protein